MAPMLITTLTMPPQRGISSAKVTARTPKTTVERRAARISVRSGKRRRRGLSRSLVTTLAEVLRMVLNELSVAKIIPPSISPSSPGGSTSRHISR